MRVYREPIEVVCDDVPRRLTWRGITHRVEHVACQWLESVPWWHTALDHPTVQVVDEEIWHVIARSGGVVGTYEIARQPETGQWWLRAVID